MVALAWERNGMEGKGRGGKGEGGDGGGRERREGRGRQLSFAPGPASLLHNQVGMTTELPFAIINGINKI